MVPACPPSQLERRPRVRCLAAFHRAQIIDQWIGWTFNALLRRRLASAIASKREMLKSLVNMGIGGSCIQLSLHTRAKALLRASGRQRTARRALLQALAWAQLLANLGVIKRFRDFSKSSCCNGGSVVCAGVACGGSVRHGRCTVVQLNATCSYLASVMSAEEAAMARGECLTAVHAPEAAVAPESAVQWAVRLTRLTHTLGEGMWTKKVAKLNQQQPRNMLKRSFR